MRLLDFVWFRYSLLFLFFCVAMALAPHPAELAGALIWVLAAVAVRQKPVDRHSILERSLQSVAAYSGAMLFYRFLRSGLALQGLVAELGVAPGEVDAVAEVWARNVALVMLNVLIRNSCCLCHLLGPDDVLCGRLSVFFSLRQP